MPSVAVVVDADLVPTLIKNLKQATTFKWAVAHATSRGLELVLDSVRQALSRGGRGFVLVGTDLASEPQALAQLKRLQEEFTGGGRGGRFEVRRYASRSQSIFHPKVYRFGSSEQVTAAVVGSANLSVPAHIGNYVSALRPPRAGLCRRPCSR